LIRREEVVQFAMKPEDGFPHDHKLSITLTGSEARQMAKGALNRDALAAIERCEELDFSSCWVSSACAIYSAPSLAGRLYRSAIWLQVEALQQSWY